MSKKLEEVGVDTLGIVASEAPRAQTYFRLRPPNVALAADVQALTHQAYGLPSTPVTPANMESIVGGFTTEVQRQLAPEVPVDQVVDYLSRKDGLPGFGQADVNEFMGHGHLAVGQFLIDHDGIVRWNSVEGRDTEVGGFPSESELLSAAKGL
jgi:hypothetical protein